MDTLSARSRAPIALALLLSLVLLLPAQGWATAFGRISGIVQDARARAVPGAHVTLQSMASGAVRTVRTDRSGRFDFPNVPLGTYQLAVAAEGFVSFIEPVTIEPGYFPSPRFRLQRRGELAEVTVSAAAQRPPLVASVTPVTLVSQTDIQRTPGAANVNSLAMITDYVPGAYESHDMLHVRGGHQTNWLIDGVEIPNTNIAENLGSQINPEDIQTLGVERGSYQADEGDRTYGIFNVIPKSGFGGENQAELAVSAGDFGQTDDYASTASHSDDFAYYASLEGNRSDLGLQTPVSRVIHDRTRGYGAFTNLQYEPGSQDAVSLIAQARQDHYQIPDCTAPLASDPFCLGQLGDEQGEADDFALLTWAHTLTSGAVLTTSLMYHFARADYDGGAGDYPIVTTFHHGSQYEGGKEELRRDASRNHLDVGLYGFAQQDQAGFSLLPTDGSGPPVMELQSPTGSLLAAWVQDTCAITPWLSLSAGVRQSRFQGAITEHATDPRYGATVTLPRVHWVLTAFWGKYYQPPPLETLSGPFLAYATAQDTRFLPLHGERDQERQFGVTIPVKGWTVATDYFITQSGNFFDHNPIGESELYLPVTDQGALIEGRELAVRSPAAWRYGQVHLAYSNQTAECFGSITGGLVTPGTGCGAMYHALDHDQRNTADLGYSVRLPRRFFVGANLSVNSGLSNGDAPPSHLPSYAILDLTVGRNITRDLSVSLTGLNIGNRHLLTDNSLTFGGVHWNDPREVYAEVHDRFHY